MLFVGLLETMMMVRDEIRPLFYHVISPATSSIGNHAVVILVFIVQWFCHVHHAMYTSYCRYTVLNISIDAGNLSFSGLIWNPHLSLFIPKKLRNNMGTILLNLFSQLPFISDSTPKYLLVERVWLLEHYGPHSLEVGILTLRTEDLYVTVSAYVKSTLRRQYLTPRQYSQHQKLLITIWTRRSENDNTPQPLDQWTDSPLIGH